MTRFLRLQVLLSRYTSIHTYMDTFTYTHMYAYVHLHTHIRIRLRTHTYTHTFTYTHIYAYVYVHTCTHTFTYTHIRIRSRTHTYTHTFTYTHIYAYVYVHTFTHTCIPENSGLAGGDQDRSVALNNMRELHGLLVSLFPIAVTEEDLSSKKKVVYIKDENTGIFYELEDIT